MFSDRDILIIKEILDEWGSAQAFKYWHGYQHHDQEELQDFVTRFLMEYTSRDFNK